MDNSPTRKNHESLKSLLVGRINELLGEMKYPIPPVELANYRGGSAAWGLGNLPWGAFY